MSQKYLRVIWILIGTYILGSLTFFLWWNDPIFKRDFYIENHSAKSVDLTTIARDKTKINTEIKPQESKNIRLNDTDRTNKNMVEFELVQDWKVLMNSNSGGLRLLRGQSLVTQNWLNITQSSSNLTTNKIFFPFYLTQYVYTFSFIVKIQ